MPSVIKWSPGFLKPVPDAIWPIVRDDEPLPAGPALVSLARWCAEHPVSSRGAALGVVMANYEDVSAVIPYLSEIPVIALEFPAFPDGRAYSQARLLRERYRYRGELRAVGAVVLDQLQLMARCGFDAFEIQDEVSSESAQAAFQTFSVSYQPDLSLPGSPW